ncbi:Repressible alkaline phosphatase [Penicillium maclennaniae]|uniref:Repressible alkaline phosphatase n=1 Tax=Penicillium maclennaniae TaxID=1343394 RepID=UPI0025423F97|nr:Repressible alkaline phosphatase [Penicillium maclennaniae]KAJ5684399.1 Repressible alkaline phosphatase [Penicillium maclennaniae]
MAGEESLLAPRPSSDQSIQYVEEESSLLTGKRTTPRRTRRGWSFWREVGAFAWAIIATIVVIVLAVVYQHESAKGHHESQDNWGPSGKPTGKRNLIFMVSDGMGPTSLSMTRSYRQHTEGLPIDDILVLDKHHIGNSRTRSSNSLVTDSAAGATAFSCGFKSYNGAISVTPDHSPCGTVLEAAHLAGYKTGLVYEDSIAEQEVGEHPLGRVVDLMMGGGRCHFLPNTTDGSCRGDDRDIVEVASKNGFKYLSDRAGFDSLNGGTQAKLPLLALLAEKDIPYEVDRRYLDDQYPSLEEMTRNALTILSEATRDSEQGFFLMIEGSRIDHAGHSNDPVAQVHEVMAYDRAFAAVLEFLENDTTPGVVVSTSDHETGGLSTARQLHKSYPMYLWLPGSLAKSKHSSEYAGAKLNEYLSGTGKDDKESKQRDYIRKTLLEEDLGVTDATDEEVERLLHPDPQVWPSYVFADIVSRRAQIGWSTHGHSAVDVNIYASSSQDAWPLVGNHENTEVGHFLADYLDLDISAVTKRLQASSYWTASGEETSDQEKYSWLGNRVGANVRLEGLDTYHGDFRKRSTDECGCGELH